MENVDEKALMASDPPILSQSEREGERKKQGAVIFVKNETK